MTDSLAGAGNQIEPHAVWIGTVEEWLKGPVVRVFWKPPPWPAVITGRAACSPGAVVESPGLLELLPSPAAKRLHENSDRKPSLSHRSPPGPLPLKRCAFAKE